MKRWWLRLAHYARPHWGGVLTLIALMLVTVGFDVLKPWPMKLIVDGVLTPLPVYSQGEGRVRVLSSPDGEFTTESESKNPHPTLSLEYKGEGFKTPWFAAWLMPPDSMPPVSQLGWLTAATVLIFLVGWSIQLLSSYLQAGLGSRMVYDLGGRLFDHLQRQSLLFHGRHRTGDLVRRVLSDSGCIRALVMYVLLPSLTAITTIIAMLAILWRLDRLLTIIAVLVTPVILILIKFFAKPMADRTYEQQVLEGEVAAMAEQTLTAIPVIQAFGREEIETRRFRDLAGRTVTAYLRAVGAGARFKVGTTAVTALGTAAVMLIGGYHVLNHSLSLGSLLVFLAYLAAMYAPLETLAYVSSQFAAASAGGRRVLEILDAKEGVTDKPGAVEAPVGAAAGHIAMRDVTFGYRANEPVLRGVDFESRPGQIIALVGPSGTGKSTLVSLVPRFFDAWSGSVTLGGVDVRDMTLASLRSKVSLVLQDPFLLPLSVAENIAYGRPGATFKEITAAARAANAEEFINRLPQGYHTLLGERGVNLSGGQRQRLAIARAVLKNAPILILDEPTSALDAQSEALVLDALQRLMADRTTLVIAHRLSTVRRASNILVLDRGAIVESGTHDELLAKRGLYHKLSQLQFQNGSEE